MLLFTVLDEVVVDLLRFALDVANKWKISCSSHVRRVTCVHVMFINVRREVKQISILMRFLIY